MSFKSLYVIGLMVLAVAIGNGCKSYYEESGASVVVGDVAAPIEVSTPDDSFSVKALYSMDGMRLWTSKGMSVCFEYWHSYTNSYLFGMVEKRGCQGGNAVIVSSTNNLTEAISALPALRKGK